MTAPMSHGDERVWLTHPETGGWFHAPAGAVDAWTELGWQVAEEPPPEPNPVLAEYVPPHLAADPEPEPESKPSKQKRGRQDSAATDSEKG